MATQHTIEIGNATIVLTGGGDAFGDGHTTGYLEFYDERHRPSLPLSSYAIYEFVMKTITDTQQSHLWNAGRITGWMEALMENAPQTFRSLTLEEHRSLLQEA